MVQDSVLTWTHLLTFGDNCTDGSNWWLQMYGRKNLRILYDAISTLCDAIGGALAEVAFLQPTTIPPPGLVLLNKSVSSAQSFNHCLE